MFDQPAAILDLETTGKDPQTAKIVEISIVKVIPDGTKDIRTMKINPGIPIPQEAVDLHGITDEMVKDMPTFPQVARAIKEFLSDCKYIVTFNGNHYDLPLLVEEFTRAGVEWEYNDHLSIDACTIFKRKEERTLAAAVRFYLNREHEGAHGAESDTLATGDVLGAMLEKYPDLKEMAPEQLALYCNYDKRTIDIAGKFGYNEDGQVVFTFGKHEGTVATTQKAYLEWMVSPKATFTTDVVKHARRIIGEIFW
jgi:DNA polymerase III subunit epsilon